MCAFFARIGGNTGDLLTISSVVEACMFAGREQLAEAVLQATP